MRPAGALLDALCRLAAQALPPPLSPPLRAARLELRRSLHLAFRLATTHHRPVHLAPTPQPGRGRLTLRLPEGVQWGRPEAIPLPPALRGSGWKAGQPRPLTLLPGHRAAANVWFLHHGGEALCLRLGLVGQVELLRYLPRLGAWRRA